MSEIYNIFHIYTIMGHLAELFNKLFNFVYSECFCNQNFTYKNNALNFSFAILCDIFAKLVKCMTVKEVLCSKLLIEILSH